MTSGLTETSGTATSHQKPPASVEIIGSVLGRSLRYQEVPADLVRQRFIGLGFSAEFADAYIAFLEATVSRPALVTHEVEKILCRPAESFADAVSAHQDLFMKH